jgi:large subunit ribosomal protein L21
MVKFQTMSTWAVLRTGGKQYKVTEGQILAVEKLERSANNTVTFNDILLVSKEGSLTVGKPKVEKAKIKAKLLGDFRDKKIRVVKYKSKSRYTRTTGHRQTKTKIQIEKIES